MSEEEKKDSDIQEQSEQLQSQEEIEQPKQQAEPEQETVQSEQQPFPLEEQPKKQLSKDKKMFLIGGAVVLLLIVVLFFKENAANINSTEKAYYPIAYLKEDVLYTYDLKNEPHKIDKITDNRLYKSEIYEDDEDAIIFSEDRKKIFYKNNIDTKQNFTLCYEDLKAEDKKIIAEDVCAFKINPDGNSCIYVTGDTFGGGKLYFYDTKTEKSTLISEDVLGILDKFSYLDVKNNRVIYPRWELDDRKNKIGMKTCVYEASLDGKNEKKIFDYTDQLIFVPESDYIYITKENEEEEGIFSVYQYDFKEEPALIVEDAVYIMALKNKKDILYITEKEESIKYIDLVEDDKGYGKNQLKIELKSSYMPVFQYEAFIYSGEGIQKSYKNVSMVYNLDENGECLFFRRKDPLNIKIRLSEFNSIREFEDKYVEKLKNSPYDLCFITPKGDELKISTGILSAIPQLSKSKEKLLISEKKDGFNNLSIVQLSKDKEEIISEEELTEDVEAAGFSGKNEQPVFLSDYYNNKGNLYYGQESPVLISNNAYIVKFDENSEKIYFIDGQDFSNNQIGILNYFENGKTEKIDENVFYFWHKGDTTIYVKSANYNFNNLELYVFDGKESIKVDSGITSYIY